jgi:hypothetical protein
MSFRIGGVVGKSTHRKCIFIQILELGDERENEIAAPNIVREITKESATERIIAHVLNACSSISVGIRLLQFFASRAGETLQQCRPDSIIPRYIDDRFMSQDSVARTTRNEVRNEEDCQRGKHPH